MVAEAAAAPSPELDTLTPRQAALVTTALAASAARLFCFAAGGTDGAWDAVAAAMASSADGGRFTRALLEATTAALQAAQQQELDVAGEGARARGAEAKAEPAAVAELVLNAVLQLLLERVPGSRELVLRRALATHVLAAKASSTGGPSAGLRAVVRVCLTALMMHPRSALGMRCAARSHALLFALCMSPTGLFLSDIFADAELLALARPMCTLVADHLRVCVLQTSPAGERGDDARANAEELVAHAAVQTASLRLCVLLLDHAATRSLAVAVLAPAVGTLLGAEQATFASRFCSPVGPEAEARNPPWVSEAVRTLVGGVPLDTIVRGWGGSSAEQAAMLFAVLAKLHDPAAKRLADEPPGACVHLLSLHAAAVHPRGISNAATNVTALLYRVVGEGAIPPLCRVADTDKALVADLGHALLARGAPA